ncbi:MAG: hypothetical protein RR772_07165 [Gordonibacter sp.]
MTLEELAAALESSGFEAWYGHFTGDHPMPYICYRFVSDSPLTADDAVIARASRWNVELYTATKNAASESAVESALDRISIWRKFEYEIPEQKCLQIIYEIEEYN